MIDTCCAATSFSRAFSTAVERWSREAERAATAETDRCASATSRPNSDRCTSRTSRKATSDCSSSDDLEWRKHAVKQFRPSYIQVVPFNCKRSFSVLRSSTRIAVPLCLLLLTSRDRKSLCCTNSDSSEEISCCEKIGTPQHWTIM